MFKGIRTLLAFDWRENRRFVLHTFLASMLAALLPVLNTLLPGYVYQYTAQVHQLGLLLMGYLLARLALTTGISGLSGASFARRTGLAGKFNIFLHENLCRVDYARLLVFDRGHLAEAGTHQQLMARQGCYHALYTAQATHYQSA